MKKIIYMILLMINIYSLYSEINNYEQILAGEVPVGKKNGEIGDVSFFFNMGGMPLEYFTFSNDNLLYVCDFINKRINIYDLNFTYIDKIEDNGRSYVFSASKILVNEDKDIIAYIDGNGLVKINKEGDEVYKIDNSKLPREVKSLKQFFLYEKNILYFDKNKIQIIDNKGKILKKTEIAREIERINNNSNDNNLSTENETNNKIDTFLKENKLVKYNEKIITGKFDQLRDYYKIISEDKTNSFVDVVDKINDFRNFISTINIKLVGYDSDSNSYWRTNTTKQYQSKPVILVCSKYGAIIDCFFNDLQLHSIAIAPCGDIYFMDRRPKNGKYLFYKITRHW